MDVELRVRREDGRDLPLLLWRFPAPMRSIASAPHGGGLALRRWVVNAQVPASYARRDPDHHLAKLGVSLGLAGKGVGMLTAADVRAVSSTTDDGVDAWATVGLGHPLQAAAPHDPAPRALVGTINVVAVLPERLSDAALVNAVATATEAKAQALRERGLDATGTATDAVCILCPDTGRPQDFGGPRSVWRVPRSRRAPGDRGVTGGGLMVCGTTSDAGKSHVVTGLCRVLHRRGVRVAPFKAQNMALNSYVTASGHEIGRAQGVQALAAGALPEVAMNPILLKPTGERTSQVVVNGEPVAHLTAAEYHERKPELLRLVLEALADLRERFDVVLCEGAGSPAEINLLDHDIVNLRVAHDAGISAIVVGDIDRGGVFAALYGTVALLPERYRQLVKGFVINKLRGDPALLFDAGADLERRCGVPTLGVLPWIDGVALDAEDSLALAGPRPGTSEPPLVDGLDIAAVRFPRLANFTDLDALALEPGVSVRLVDDPIGLGSPDLVVLPGSKATVSDLAWLRARGLDAAIRRSGALVLGVCGGYQMLGRRIVDDVESGAGEVDGLGWLDAETVFEPAKLVRQVTGTAMGQRLSGYEIHHGRTKVGDGAASWIHLDGGEEEGAVDLADASVLGTSVHGLFEQDAFRATFLTELGRRRDKTFVSAGVSFAGARDAQFDRLADLLETHLDIAAIEALLG